MPVENSETSKLRYGRLRVISSWYKTAYLAYLVVLSMADKIFDT